MVQSQNNPTEQKKLNDDVKDCIGEPSQFTPRADLRRWIFINKGLTYASLRDLLQKHEIKTTRQYLYGICSGRLTPSYTFAKKLCEILGVDNIFYFFNPTEFPILEKEKIKNET